jgi:VWA domain containing CoxE-like protein
VIVMSDGYDTDPTEALTVELKCLKGRARRLVWLNPLLGWKDYAPVARAMAAALDHIDCFATAHSLASLAALEDEFVAGFPACRLSRKWCKIPIFRSFCDAQRARTVERRNRVSRKIKG